MLIAAGLSHCVLLGGCSCTGTSFGWEHFTRVWTQLRLHQVCTPGPKDPGTGGWNLGQTPHSPIQTTGQDSARDLVHPQQGPEQGHSHWLGRLGTPGAFSL